MSVPNTNFISFYTIYLLIFFYSCANVVAPTGGEKDQTPPRLIYSNPANGTTNFSGKSITLVFDEDIQVDNLNNTWMVSPPFTLPAENKTHRNKVTIEFPETLLSNTTYRIVLDNAIKDITEMNPITDLTLSFSTGKTIDSLSVKGVVKSLKTLLPVQGALIFLTPVMAKDTSPCYEKKPFYISRSIADGIFSLENLKPGTYFLYALTDKNKNYQFDPGSELIAFTGTFTFLKNNIDDVSLFLYKEDYEKPYIVKSDIDSKNRITMTFNEGLDTFAIYTNQKEKRINLPFTFNPEKNMVKVYPGNFTDSLDVVFFCLDSCFNKMQDTLTFVRDTLHKTDTLLYVNSEPQSKTSIPSLSSLVLKFSEPVVRNFITEIQLVIDSSKRMQLNVETDLVWNYYKNECKIKKNISFSSKIVFVIPSCTFESVNGLWNEKTILSFSNDPLNNYGSISGKIKTKENNYILDLFDARNYKFETLYNPTQFNFQILKPGKYYIRVLVDRNNNHRWDSGKINQNLLPEQYFFFNDILPLKPNWDIENVVIGF